MTIELFYIVILVLTGMLVGFTTGLLGLGGGFIMVPILFFLLENLGVDSTLAIRMAFGTSLAAILPTALSSSYGHYRKHEVILKAAMIMGIFGFGGALIGGYISAHTPGDILKIIFALILLLVALRMLIFKEPTDKKEKRDNLMLFIVWGFIAGLTSGLVGIGGGVILIPVMVLLFGFNMVEAAGTSSAFIVLTSLGGILSYISSGLNTSGLPPYSLGYINLLQLVMIIGCSIPMAQFGTWAAHRLPEKQLRYIFVILLIFISFKMLGVFGLLGLPL